MLDRDDWSGSWQATHKSFQLLNTVEWWAQASQSVRGRIGKPITRDSVRDGLQNVRMANSLIGPVEFDENGDLKNKVISVFQVNKDASKPLDSMDDQFKYMGIAPMS